MIQKNDDDKTTTQPKRERERERKRFENACNNHPNNRDTYQSYERKICSKLSTQISKFRHHKREEGTTKTISLSFGRSTFRPTK